MAGYRRRLRQGGEVSARLGRMAGQEEGRSARARSPAGDAGRRAAGARSCVQNHCYRADEMAQMLDLAREFGFHIRAFHHAVEAYKIADLLARDSVASAVWADWWGFKMESLDGIPENAALLQQAGARAIIHSDIRGGHPAAQPGGGQGDVGRP